MKYEASNPGFNYYGRWHVAGIATTLNSGALVEFAYTGSACKLDFDVTGFTFFPAVFVQVDNGPVSQATLSASAAQVEVRPQFNEFPIGSPPFANISSKHHLVRFWIAANSLYQTQAAGTQWSGLNGGCQFIGASIRDGGLMRLPYATRQIEFLGDSITQGLRLLYTGEDDDTNLQRPYMNWPQLVADLLGSKPIVNGFGGQGLTIEGTCGVPVAQNAFPFIYNDIRWRPPVKPLVAVIYYGVNDSVSTSEFGGLYSTYLSTVTSAYADARIFAICPHGKPDYASAIQKAAATFPKVLFLDYSLGIISGDETCDGCHLNPGGAVKLAATLAADIQKE